MTYLRTVRSTRSTPQSEPIPGSGQVPNSAGGYAWAVDDWARLRRWLILGSESGSYYASQRALSLENAEAVARCLATAGPRTVAEIVAISEAGRAPKNDPALYALALAMADKSQATRQAAYAALPAVARTGTHLLHLAAYLREQRGWSRGLRRVVGDWFLDKSADSLALQVVKYPSRDGWALADLLRLAHPHTGDAEKNAILRYVVDGTTPFMHGTAIDEAHESIFVPGDLPPLIVAAERIKGMGPKDAAALIRETRLPREGVPSELLTSPEVWDALLVDMPMTAMIRNLATMTRVGLLAPLSDAARLVRERLADGERIRKARVHPIQILAAHLTYAAGRGARSDATWQPVGQIVEALDAAFYLAFGNVVPSGKRTLLAIDVSGSMDGGVVAGVPGLTPRLAAAAMALVTAATEPDWGAVGFSHQLVPLDISPRQRLADVAYRMRQIPMGGTDCALPMLWAARAHLNVDTFAVYTDSETWYGDQHPAQALRAYRAQTSQPARLAVVGMVANGFSIADPRDAGMLDVVGFDTATPQLLADFSRGDV